jgi:hypothetical protein
MYLMQNVYNSESEVSEESKEENENERDLRIN